ncbi:MAG: sulfotransferase domain-containing protein [Sphingobacteriales bacterium]|nr:MAG: sulfotransferase domain-containing protein [Sphingobacteriales bacterium]
MNNFNRTPSFFIAGAPKCGTTAMYEYLKQHPQIFLPDKELYFFGSDFTFREPRPKLEYYLSLFADAAPDLICGEASVWYLYSKNAAKEIKQFNPGSKIIIMLRNPVQMLYSLHSQQVYEGNENIPVFEDALMAEGARRKGVQIPPLIGCPVEGLYYSEVVRFTPQLKRYFEVFGREQVKVIIYDDFAKDAALIYKQTLQFLGVDDTFTVNAKRINPNKKIKYPFLRNFLKKRDQRLIRLVKVLLPSKSLRSWIQKKLWSVNTRYVERQPINPETKQLLQQAFKKDIEELSQLLDRNLMHWVES